MSLATTPEQMTSTDLFSFNEVKVSYTSKKVGIQISSSKHAYDLLAANWSNIDYEESFKIILLNRGNRVLGVCRISVGSISATVADPKKIFQTALAANASAVILAHNHPSGNVKPSLNDQMITNKCKQVGGFLDLPVLDHIVVTKDGYYSFADEGLI